MLKRPVLPLAVSLTFSLVGALYVLWIRNEIPGALTYGVVVPGALLIPLAFARAAGTSVVRWLTNVYWITTAMVALNLLGTLWLHAHPFQYDRILHFSIAFLSLVIASHVSSLFGYSSKTAFVIVFAGLFLFEFYQWGSDQLIGTQLFTDSRQAIVRDTFEDIVFGFLGLLAAIPIARKRLE